MYFFFVSFWKAVFLRLLVIKIPKITKFIIIKIPQITVEQNDIS